MILTNKFKYPSTVVAAVKSELYQPTYDVMRVSELIDSPLVKYLLIKFWDKLEIDVDEVIYSSLFGTAWHKFLSAFETNEIIEKRWSVNYSGIILSGQTDVYSPARCAIEDNKTQSAWAFVFGNTHWPKQLNSYAQLVEENGYPVRELWINSFLRDWSKYEAMKGRNKDYPEHKFHRIQIPLWDAQERKDFILNRLEVHKADGSYECTSEDKWERPTTYAVKKKGVKTAKRVLDTKEEAEQWIAEKKPKGDIYIETRKGSCVRCEGYCTARSVCPIKGAI